MIRNIFMAILIIGLVWSCTTEKNLPENIVSGIEEIRTQFVPDKRIKVFKLEYKFEDGRWNFSGETTEAEAQSALQNLLSQNFSETDYALNFDLLPHPALGDSVYAVVSISVAPIRREPKHSDEMVDQSIMGTELKLLKKERYWYLAQTPYQYLGWISGTSIRMMSRAELDEWKKAPKTSVIKNYSQVLSEPNPSSLPVCDAVLGSQFQKIRTMGQWIKVETPGGESGYILKSDCIESIPGGQTKFIDTKKLVSKSKSMLGIPYLWGGNSTKGLDCSGFTQTVFRTGGMLLPRDANMQVNEGDEIIPDENFSNVQAGDLVFFGPEDGRITHVGISLGGYKFIHSSGNVHINSLNPEDEDYNEYRHSTLRKIKRVIKN